MTNIANKLNGSMEVENTEETKLDLPTDIGDTLEICKQYMMLGLNIQTQLEWLIELGIEEAITERKVNVEALPHIRNFLENITEKMFGDIIEQSYEVMMMIDNYELTHPQAFQTRITN